MNQQTDAPPVEQDTTPVEFTEVNSVAASLFGDEIEASVESVATIDTVTPEVELTLESVPAVVTPPPAPVAVVQPAAVAPAAQQFTAEQQVQFAQWQQAQQAQQPVAQQQQVAPQQRQEPQQAAPLTQEQQDTMLNRYYVTESDYNALFTEPDPVKSRQALDNMLQAAVRQAVTMSHHLVLDAQQKVIGQVSPYMQFADGQREIMTRQAFYGAHPDLSGAEVLVNAVMSQLIQEKQAGRYTPASEEQIFSDLAQRTKALKTQMSLGGQNPQQQPVGQQRVQQVKPAMAMLPTRSQAGHSSASSGVPVGQSATAVNIFG